MLQPNKFFLLFFLSPGPLYSPLYSKNKEFTGPEKSSLLKFFLNSVRPIVELLIWQAHFWLQRPNFIARNFSKAQLYCSSLFDSGVETQVGSVFLFFFLYCCFIREERWLNLRKTKQRKCHASRYIKSMNFVMERKGLPKALNIFG